MIVVILTARQLELDSLGLVLPPPVCLVDLCQVTVELLVVIVERASLRVEDSLALLEVPGNGLGGVKTSSFAASSVGVDQLPLLHLF